MSTLVHIYSLDVCSYTQFSPNILPLIRGLIICIQRIRYLLLQTTIEQMSTTISQMCMTILEMSSTSHQMSTTILKMSQLFNRYPPLFASIGGGRPICTATHSHIGWDVCLWETKWKKTNNISSSIYKMVNHWDPPAARNRATNCSESWIINYMLQTSTDTSTHSSGPHRMPETSHHQRGLLSSGHRLVSVLINSWSVSWPWLVSVSLHRPTVTL